MLVGISPFGIWRPGNPPGIVGLDQYSTLYADARKWQQEGWLDYLTPQLYWQVESKGQSYPKLLGWWAEQNVKKRHLWPGNFTSKIRRKPRRRQTRKHVDGRGAHPADRSHARDAGRNGQRPLQHEGAYAELRRHHRQAEGRRCTPSRRWCRNRRGWARRRRASRRSSATPVGRRRCSRNEAAARQSSLGNGSCACKRPTVGRQSSCRAAKIEHVVKLADGRRDAEVRHGFRRIAAWPRRPAGAGGNQASATNR